MVLWFLELFSSIPGQRLVFYISFRSLMAILTSFLIGVFFGKKLINIIYQLNFRDKARDYGGISSKNKIGTPTMGGLIIFISFLASVLLWGNLNNFFIKVILFAGFWFTALGFFDDYLKNVRGSVDSGMSRGLKLFFQALFGLILALLVLSQDSSPFPKDIITELLLSLNTQDGGEIAMNLYNIYLYFKKRLLEANVQKDEGIIREVIVHLKELRDAWEKISAKETISNAMSIDKKGNFSIEG